MGICSIKISRGFDKDSLLAGVVQRLKARKSSPQGAPFQRSIFYENLLHRDFCWRHFNAARTSQVFTFYVIISPINFNIKERAGLIELTALKLKYSTESHRLNQVG